MRWFTILCLTLTLFLPDSALAQAQGRISGRVVGEAGQPLSGASVIIEGTRQGALTGPDGQFTLQGIAAGTHTVTAALIGYGSASQEVTVSADAAASVTFTLRAQAVELDGIVAIGYGTTSKKELTGSVATISGDDVTTKAAPTSAVSNALQGKAPGVQVVVNSGIPGAGASVRVRGTNSLSANSEPLYVVDGVPATSGTRSEDPTQNPLNTINPNDIESIQVLKDASATAIYGARGANGVVLITTKRGKSGQNLVSLESSYGVQQIAKTIPMLNAQQWMTLVNEALVNGGSDPKFSQNEIQSAQTYNLVDQMVRTSPQQSHTLTFQGGDEKTRYLISGNFLDQQGIVLGTSFERLAGRLNLDRNVSEQFRIGTNLSIAKTSQNLSEVENGGVGAGARGILAAMQWDPHLAPKDADGNWNRKAIMGEQISNPLAAAEELINQRNQMRFLGSIFGEYDLTDELTLRSSVSANLWNEYSPRYAPSTIDQGFANKGVASIWQGQSTEVVNENLLTYRRDLAGNSLDLTGGFTVQTNEFRSTWAGSSGFTSDALLWNNLGAGVNGNQPQSGISESSLLSYLGRAVYNIDGKYILTATGRYDGSSRFGANNKWAMFPSAAFAWRLIDESFMQDQELFSDLKLRVSYGKTGNQAIEEYQSLARLQTRRGALGNGQITGVAYGGAAPNPNLRWETTGQFNAGLDMGFVDNRISFSVDAYHSRTDDLLLQVPLPRTSGFSSQYQNIGSVQNVGVELGLSTVNVETDNFSWRSTLNVSANRNEVVDLGEETIRWIGAPRFGGFIQGNQSHVLKVGQPLGAMVGFKTEGLWQQGDTCTLTDPRPGIDCVPGELKIVDANGDGKINTDDRQIIGYAEPKFYGGFSNNVRYGPLTLDAFVNFSYGNEIVNGSMVFLKNVTGFMNETTDALDRWTPENTDTEVPRANVKRARFIYDGLVEDGSFVRLQALTLGYDVPTGLLPGTQQARLYVTGQNLFTLTNYSGFDPEVNSAGGNPTTRGLDIGAYPRARVWNVGVNVTF